MVSIYNVFLNSIRPKLNSKAYASPELSFSNNSIVLSISSFAINLMSLALPLMTLQVYDRILVSQNVYTLYVLAAGVIVVVLLDAIIKLCRIYVVNWTGAVHEYTVYSNMMRHLLAVEQNIVEQQGSVGAYMQKMGYIAKLKEFFSGQALITLIDIPFVLIFICLIAYIAKPLVLLPLAVLAVFFAVAKILSYDYEDILQQKEETDTKRLDFIIEVLRGIRTVKSMAAEDIFKRKYETLQLDSSIDNYSYYRYNYLISNYSNIFTQIMIIGIVVFGAPMALHGEITLGTLIACVLLSARIMQPVQRAFNLWGRHKDFLNSLEDINNTFDIPSVEKFPLDSKVDNKGTLEIKNLSFVYKEKEILKDINLKLSRGEVISISGDKSNPKNALLKLIVGAYKPSSGNVVVNDIEASKYPVNKMGKHIAYLSMNGIVIRGTIWDNLTSLGEYKESEIKEIVKLIGLDEDIKKLPEGYSTWLEGSLLDVVNPGLKQKISIARALIPKPRLILFDNADKSLDRQGYNNMYKLVARLKGMATLILVTDDKNLKDLATANYVLCDGKLRKELDAENHSLQDSLVYKELPI